MKPKNKEENKPNLELKSSLNRKDKTSMKTMRQMSRKISKKFLARKKTQKKFSVILTKEEIEEKINYFKKIYGPSSSYQLCLQAIYYPPHQRTVELNNMISYYLRNLKNFVHILSGENEDKFELILYQIASHLIYEKYNENELICKYGDIGDKFYIILKGKVAFLVPTSNKYYMSEEEYIEHLIKLRFHQEIDLIKNIITNNQFTYFLGNNLDEFINNALEKHEKNKENKYSIYLYNKFYEYRKFINKEKRKEKLKNDINNNNNNNIILNDDNIDGNTDYNNKNKLEYEDYIFQTSVHIDKNKIQKRKPIIIFEYQKTNIYSEGDTFGELSLTSKKNKRTATAICYENCYLGALSKKEFKEFLENIIEKTNNRLYDFVMKNNIFVNMMKNKFVTKYSHMFHFLQYNKNSIILNEKEEIKNLIIFSEGEFSLSVNKNLIELNEIIIKYKKIKAQLTINNNNDDDGDNKNNDYKKKETNFQEIEENNKILINMKNFSKDIKDIINERHNFILTKIKNEFCLGYPDTVDPILNTSLLNCQCTSDYASAYTIRKEMLNYIDKENNFKRKYPEIIISKIDLFLKRFNELKSLINKKLKNKHQYNVVMGDINPENEKKPVKENKEDINNDNKYIIQRNFDNLKKKNKNNLISFNKKILSNDINKNLLQNKFNNNINIFKSTQNPTNNKYVSLISKFRKGISNKQILLTKAQYHSQKFLQTEKQEIKKYLRNAMRVKNKENYIDFSSMFAKKPRPKKTILDKFKKIVKEDNVLDPQINKLKSNKFNLYLISNNNNKKNNNININNITSKTFDTLYKVFNEGNNINDVFKNESKFNLNSYDTFSSFYSNSTTLANLSKQPLYTNGKNIKNINLNNLDINGEFTNYADSYNKLYYKYIYDKMKNEKNYNESSYEGKNNKDNNNKNNNDKFLLNTKNNNFNIDAYKTKQINTSPNKFIFPSIDPYLSERIRKKQKKSEIKKIKNNIFC